MTHEKEENGDWSDYYWGQFDCQINLIEMYIINEDWLWLISRYEEKGDGYYVLLHGHVLYYFILF